MHVKVWNYNAWKTGFGRKLELALCNKEFEIFFQIRTRICFWISIKIATIRSQMWHSHKYKPQCVNNIYICLMKLKVKEMARFPVQWPIDPWLSIIEQQCEMSIFTSSTDLTVHMGPWYPRGSQDNDNHRGGRWGGGVEWGMGCYPHQCLIYYRSVSHNSWDLQCNLYQKIVNKLFANIITTLIFCHYYQVIRIC